MPSHLVEEGKKYESKFEKTRTILYGESYDKANVFGKMWYNTYSFWRLKKAETGNALSAAGRWISKTATNAAGAVKDWYKESGFGEAVQKAGSKVASAAKTVKDTTVKGAKAAGELLAAGAQKVYEAGKSFRESKFAKEVANRAKKIGGWFKAGGAWIKDKAVRISESAAARKLAEGAKAAGHKIAQVAKGAGEIALNGLDKVVSPVVSGAKKLHNSAFGRSVRSIAAKFGNKTAETVKGLAHHAASGYDYVKSKYTDWKFAHDRKYGTEENRIHEMLRNNESGKAYEEKMSRFREDVLKQKEIQSHIRIRANKERIKRNAGAMEKGNTGDVELVEMNSEGKFVREDPGEGMLQSLSKYDLANVIIPDTEELKRAKLNLEELQKKAKKEPAAEKNKVLEGAKKLQSEMLNTAFEAEAYAGGFNKTLPASGFAKAFGNIVNMADGKEKEKNMAGLVTNLMDQAGKILKLYDKGGSYANLAGALNIGVTGLKMPPADADKLKQAQICIKDIQAGMKILGAGLKQGGIKNALADQSFYLGPILTIMDGVDEYNRLAKTNEKLNALTQEDKSLNLTDGNVIRHLGQGANDLVRQNEVKQNAAVMNTAINASISAVGLATGTGGITYAVTTALSHVSPVDLVVHQMKNKTDRELMMEDVFGSMDAYRKYKDQYGLRGSDIDREILRQTGNGSIKEYASRVRAETALHLHSRMKQAEQFGIENGATKVAGAGGLKGKSAQEIYKEIGGREDFDKIVGREKSKVHEDKLKEYKARKEQEYKKQVQERNLQSTKTK